jgi:hypothetical protein
MQPVDLSIRLARGAVDVRAAHHLFRRRIGPTLVEDWDSFLISASGENAYWAPLLLLAEVQGTLAGAQLGGLLPEVQMLSLPYTAVESGFEGLGIYTRIKQAMIAELRGMARERGLPEPRGNVSEEAPDSAQYARKVLRGNAVVLPIRYMQPAAQGLEERTLALTYEPLSGDAPAFTREDALRITAAVYRALYRIAEPERHPAFQRMTREP